MTVLLWILLIIAALIVLLLTVPFGVHAAYIGGELRLDARLLWFNIPLIPGRERKKRPEKKRKKERPAKEEKAAGEEEKERKKKGLPAIDRSELAPLLRLALKTLDRFRKKFTVNRLMIHFIAAAEDPYDAAMMYGYANAAAGIIGGLSERGWDIRSRDIQTAVDFESTEPAVDAEITVTISLGRMLAVLLAAAWGFLKIKRAARKNVRAEKDERMNDDGTDADPNGGIPSGQHV